MSSTEQIIYIANTGELLGYHAVLSGDQYPDSAAVIEDSVIAHIPKEDFMEVLHRSELLTRRLLKILSHEFSVLVNSLTVVARIAPGEVVETNMSRDDLVGLVGTCRADDECDRSCRLARGLCGDSTRDSAGGSICGCVSSASFFVAVSAADSYLRYMVTRLFGSRYCCFS